MRRRGAVLWLGLVLSWTFINATQVSRAWAQTSQEKAAAAAVFIDRAVVAYGERKYEEALKELQQALQLNPESVDALYYQGLAYAALKRPADARAALEKARALRPADLDVAFQLGVLNFSEQQYEKAEPLLRQVHQSEPTRPNVGYYLGFIEYRKKNYREALDLLRANVPSDDNFAQLARFYTGLAMSALGFAREARAEIEEALRLQPVSPLTAPAQRFGEVIERAADRERFFRGELRVGIFYDTNVPVVPNSSSDLTAATIRDDTDNRKSEGELGVLGLSYTWLRTPDWEGEISHRFLQTYNNHITKFNAQSHTPAVSILKRGTVPSAFGNVAYTMGMQVAYDFITLGNSRFTQRWIVNPYVTLVENSWNLTTLQYRFQWKDFFNDRKVARREIRDAKNYMIGPLHFFIFEQGRHYIKLGYQYDAELAEGENWSYWGNRLLFGGQYTLPWGDVRLRYDLDFHWRFHKHQHSLIPADATDTVRRRDREPVHLISIAKGFLTDFSKAFPFGGCDLRRDDCPFAVSVEYLFDKNKSNLAPFDYNRHVVTTSVTWRFGADSFEGLETLLQSLGD